MDLSENSSIAEENSLRENSSATEREIVSFLCLIWAGGKLGAACYETESFILKVFNDKLESGPDFYITKKLCQQLSPTNVIISSKNDEKWLQTLKEEAVKDYALNEEEDEEMQNETINVIPNKDFAYEGAKNRLQLIQLPNMPKLLSKTERELYFSSFFDFQNINMIRAAGALLKNLDKLRCNVELEDDNINVPILAVEIISLEDLVFIDTRSYQTGIPSALQIFQNETHPSAFKTSNKEGLSLYGIFNQCRTTLGSKEMWKYFLRPTTDLKILEGRLDAISYLNESKNLEVTSTLKNHVKNISDVLRILKLMITSEISVNEWHILYKTIYSAIIISDIARALPQNIPIFKKIKDLFNPELYRIAVLIDKTIDFEEAIRQNHFCVKEGIDEELETKKRFYAGLPNMMHAIALQELQNLDERIPRCSVIYLPRLGYLLAIPEMEGMEQNNYELPNLQYLFVCNKIIHYKSARTLELDRQLGDTHYEIRDRENHIMQGLQDLILEISQTIYDVVMCSAELDCLLAMAAVAKEFNYVRPKLIQETKINIKNGRHPLQELCVPSFVNNDLMADADAKITILTGPNASGKSVYLKQVISRFQEVGLLTFMAHIGSFVPAESAEIGLIDGIFTQIHSKESISLSLSTFMVDINQISLCLEKATSNSLVIIDEFGQGTDAVDGLALLTAVLNYWIRKPHLTPLAFVSTHFHALTNLLHITNIIKLKTLEVLTNEEEQVFLYNLIDGTADGSYAHRVAAKAGIPGPMINRSLQISETLREAKTTPTPLLTTSVKAKIKECDEICSALLRYQPQTGDLTDLYQVLEDNQALLLKTPTRPIPGTETTEAPY